MKSFLVIGLGRFGTALAQDLCRQGNEVMVVDMQEETLRAIADHVTHAVTADARDPEVLRAIGAKNFDCAIVACSSDVGDSTLITLNLKELGVPKIVCKAHDETHRRVLEKLGADQVVIPEQEQASRLARSLSSPNVLDYIELSDEYGIIEVPAPINWEGKSLRELNVRAKLGLNILAIRRGGTFNVSPAADFAFAQGDIMVVLGNSKALKKVQKL